MKIKRQIRAVSLWNILLLSAPLSEAAATIVCVGLCVHFIGDGMSDVCLSCYACLCVCVCVAARTTVIDAERVCLENGRACRTSRVLP